MFLVHSSPSCVSVRVASQFEFAVHNLVITKMQPIEQSSCRSLGILVKESVPAAARKTGYLPFISPPSKTPFSIFVQSFHMQHVSYPVSRSPLHPLTWTEGMLAGTACLSKSQSCLSLCSRCFCGLHSNQILGNFRRGQAPTSTNDCAYRPLASMLACLSLSASVVDPPCPDIS